MYSFIFQRKITWGLDSRYYELQLECSSQEKYSLQQDLTACSHLNQMS
uniref:Uncharacterized protein n=1 Tax=Rhizophora mucronata TaxID=61149 RepID=A0A2P2NLD9_RHIMU